MSTNTSVSAVTSVTAVSAPPEISMMAVHRIVKGYFKHEPWIYWCDFLGSFFLGLTAYMLVPFLSLFSWQQVAAYLVSVFAFYRSALFIHEIVHFRDKTMLSFRIVWNLLFGLPFLMPTFTYKTHLDHHVRKHFATHDDGEYLPLAVQHPLHLLFYFCHPLFMPILTMLRFLVFAPLSWISSAVSRVVHARASSMVIDLSYVRSQPSQRELRIIRLQEVGCTVICWGVMLWLLFVNRYPLTYWTLVQVYATAVGVLFLNHFRTLGAHRFTNLERREMTFTEQLLDSVNYPNSMWLGELAMPVGLRYHALHHLCPGIPYHNLGKAHRKLMAELPADSIYRRTISRSLFLTVMEVFRGAWQHRNRKQVSRAEVEATV